MRNDPRIWSEEQVRLLRENWTMHDEDLAVLVSAHGRERTRMAVYAERVKLGLPKSPAPWRTVVPQDFRRGWPVMKGTHEERDRRYQRILIREAIRLGLVSAPPPRPAPMPAQPTLVAWPATIVPPAVRAVLQDVADVHGVSIAEMEGGTRSRHVVHARQEAMWRLRKLRKDDGSRRFSTTTIGRFLGARDHATVIHGAQAHERRMAGMAAE